MTRFVVPVDNEHRTAQCRSRKNDTKQSAEDLAILDVALIHGRSTCTMLANGARQEALYTDMYRKREGTWVRVSACAIAPGA
ncbi:hypothetical protein GCM10009733_050590 [Nonomuraea maheshkhaliensis]|uniref:Transposase IS111A/IS1328/IS1533 N-terminal domain-containing protein n=1 Tax=Nonomuraea maheshkhaliensis TaxID=419590 RepID=A0ABN2FHM1_9ACTN